MWAWIGVGIAVIGTVAGLALAPVTAPVMLLTVYVTGASVIAGG